MKLIAGSSALLIIAAAGPPVHCLVGEASTLAQTNLCILLQGFSVFLHPFISRLFAFKFLSLFVPYFPVLGYFHYVSGL